MEPELFDAIGDYLLAHVERHGHVRTAEAFGVPRHTLWRFLERGLMRDRSSTLANGASQTSCSVSADHLPL